MQVLRDHWPRPIENDVVLVGIDEGSEEVFTEPVALWHRHFARLFVALAEARPRAVGVDVVPPERSYDDIVPGYDLALFRSIRDLRQKTVAVFALTVDREGRAARMHPTFARVIGEEGLGIDQQLRDPDSVSRRFDEAALGTERTARTLVGQMLRGLGLPVEAGYIDYSVGARMEYIPMQDVIAWKEQGQAERLREAFAGRIVLVGYVLKRADRWELPGAPDRRRPGRRARATEPARRHHPPAGDAQPPGERPAAADGGGAALGPVPARRRPRLLSLPARDRPGYRPRPHRRRGRRRPLCHPRAPAPGARRFHRLHALGRLRHAGDRGRHREHRRARPPAAHLRGTGEPRRDERDARREPLPRRERPARRRVHPVQRHPRRSRRSRSACRRSS